MCVCALIFACFLLLCVLLYSLNSPSDIFHLSSSLSPLSPSPSLPPFPLLLFFFLPFSPSLVLSHPSTPLSLSFCLSLCLLFITRTTLNFLRYCFDTDM